MLSVTGLSANPRQSFVPPVWTELVEAVFTSTECGVLPGRVSARLPTHFLLLRQEKVSKEKASRSQGRCAVPCAARFGWGRAQTRLRLRQVPALIQPYLRCSALPERRGDKIQRRQAGDMCLSFRHTATNTRGHMKSPSIAQRGEGGDRGGSGELRLGSKASRYRSVIPTLANPRDRLFVWRRKRKVPRLPGQDPAWRQSKTASNKQPASSHQSTGCEC
jgi:hypothetical protein